MYHEHMYFHYAAEAYRDFVNATTDRSLVRCLGLDLSSGKLLEGRERERERESIIKTI